MRRTLYLAISICLLSLFTVTSAVAQSTDTYTGTLSDNEPDLRLSVPLSAGQTINLTAEATSGNLDTYLLLLDSSGNTVAENDDRAFGDYDSFLTYTATRDGVFTVVLTNIRGTSGTYQLQVSIAPGAEAQAQGAGDGGGAQVYTGFMSDTVSDARYPVELAVGQGLVATTEATSGDLDTAIYIKGPDGRTVALNDDRGLRDLNSQAVTIAEVGGVYEVIVTNIAGTSGEYKLEIAVTSAEEAERRSRIELSGTPQRIETAHFRIHYTLEGVDATTPEYAQLVADTMEEVYAVQVVLLGWPTPPRDGLRGGNDRYDVYVMDLINSDVGGDLGFASAEFPAGDNPATERVEERAVPSYLALDNDYDFGLGEDSTALLRATAAHEFHHAIQFGFDQQDDFDWYYEATSSWMETVTVGEDEDATGYVQTLFDYPELCFGTQAVDDPTGGIMMYGLWLFMQNLTDTHGDQIMFDLWTNIALYDNWEPLERTLNAYDDTIPGAVQRFHLTNLVRDYRLTPSFEAETVWVEGVINAVGAWEPTGRGIQEMAANYYMLDLPPALYTITVDAPQMALWAVGVRDNVADAFLLNAAGTVDTSAYDEMVLMVFNESYDGDLNDCTYFDYRLDVKAGGTPPGAPTLTLDAAQYRTPGG